MEGRCRWVSERIEAEYVLATWLVVPAVVLGWLCSWPEHGAPGAGCCAAGCVAARDRDWAGLAADGGGLVVAEAALAGGVVAGQRQRERVEQGVGRPASGKRGRLLRRDEAHGRRWQWPISGLAAGPGAEGRCCRGGVCPGRSAAAALVPGAVTDSLGFAA